MHRKYRCLKCGHEWAGHRLEIDERTGRRFFYRDEPLRGGMTWCVKCQHGYVEWLNWREILDALGPYWKRR